MAFPTVQPVIQYFDLAGEPLEGGFIYIGTANTDPETNPIEVYYDLDGAAVASQPIRTIAGYPARSGSPTGIYTDTASYSIRVREQDSSGDPGDVVFYFAEVPTALVTASEFGAILIAAADAEEAREIIGVEIGVDVQAYSDEIATIAATEVEMRAQTLTDLRSMTPEDIGFAIDETGTFVRVTEDDTTPGYLEDKLAGGVGVDLTVTNPGANETITIEVDGAIKKEEQLPATGDTSLPWVDLPVNTNGIDVSFRTLGDLSVNTYIRLGTSAGFETSGYLAARADFYAGTDYVQTSATAGFQIGGNGSANGSNSGTVRLRRISGNQWVCDGLYGTDSGNSSHVWGRINLPGELDRIQIFTSSAFTSGDASIQYWSGGVV